MTQPKKLRESSPMELCPPVRHPGLPGYEYHVQVVTQPGLRHQEEEEDPRQGAWRWPNGKGCSVATPVRRLVMGASGAGARGGGGAGGRPVEAEEAQHLP